MLRENSSSALCYMATIFWAAALRKKSALQAGTCNTAFLNELSEMADNF